MAHGDAWYSKTAHPRFNPELWVTSVAFLPPYTCAPPHCLGRVASQGPIRMQFYYCCLCQNLISFYLKLTVHHTQPHHLQRRSWTAWVTYRDDPIKNTSAHNWLLAVRLSLCPRLQGRNSVLVDILHAQSLVPSLMSDRRQSKHVLYLFLLPVMAVVRRVSWQTSGRSPAAGFLWTAKCFHWKRRLVMLSNLKATLVQLLLWNWYIFRVKTPEINWH